MADVLKASDLAKRLKEFGLVPENTRRIIIDVEVGEPVKLYFDTFAKPTLTDAIDAEFLMNAKVVRHADGE